MTAAAYIKRKCHTPCNSKVNQKAHISGHGMGVALTYDTDKMGGQADGIKPNG